MNLFWSPLSLPSPRKAGRGWPQAGRGVGSLVASFRFCARIGTMNHPSPDLRPPCPPLGEREGVRAGFRGSPAPIPTHNILDRLAHIIHVALGHVRIKRDRKSVV